MMILALHLTFLRRGQICVPVHLYGENIENSVSQNVKTNKIVKVTNTYLFDITD